jgi:hypothetical protein
MSSLALIEASINRLPADQRPPLIDAFREAVKQLRLGAPSTASPPAPVPAENFGGHLVPFTTPAVANTEFAVAHQLGRTPRTAVPAVAVGTAGSAVVEFVVARGADSAFLYLSCPKTSVSGLLYVE